MSQPIKLEAGDQAPDFSLEDQNGRRHALADYQGRRLVLYFYPRDNTPGCTKESCSFQAQLEPLRQAGAEVLGASPQGAASHAKFATQYGLTFPLLVDEEKTLAQAYGAYGEKVLYGKTTVGMIRKTFIIGPDGKIQKAWHAVKADGHGEVVLKWLRENP